MGFDGEILFLCHRIPFPPDRGDKIRSFNLLKALGKIAPVHVGSFADDDRDADFADALKPYVASQKIVRRRASKTMAGMRALLRGQPILVSLYDDDELHRWVHELMASRLIRAVVAYSVQMAQYVPVLGPDCRFLMDFVDFDSAKYSAYGTQQGGPMGWINRREGRELFRYECDVARRADVSTFVTAAEAELFRKQAQLPEARITHFDNGVDHGYFNPDAPLPSAERTKSPLLVFTGQMDYRPNIEAVDSFARQTLPLIRQQHPDAHFIIVGRNPAPEVTALGSLPGVYVTGGVADVRGWLKSADVVVAPLRIARGIQNKVLEAMAMEKPVVVSPQAAEGIDAQDGIHFIIAPRPEEEASAVLALLAKPERAAAMGRAARARVIERYDWGATLASIPVLLSGRA